MCRKNVIGMKIQMFTEEVHQHRKRFVNTQAVFLKMPLDDADFKQTE